MLNNVRNEKKGGLDFSSLLVKSSIDYQKPKIIKKVVVDDIFEFMSDDDSDDAKEATDSKGDDDSITDDMDLEYKEDKEDNEEEYVNNLDNPLELSYH